VALGAGVGVGAGRDEDPYGGGAVGVVAGPVGDHVQCGTAVDMVGGELRVPLDELA
jgi:hypothetical protein